MVESSSPDTRYICSMARGLRPIASRFTSKKQTIIDSFCQITRWWNWPGRAAVYDPRVQGSVAQAVTIERFTCLRMSLPNTSAILATAKSCPACAGKTALTKYHSGLTLFSHQSSSVSKTEDDVKSLYCWHS